MKSILSILGLSVLILISACKNDPIPIVTVTAAETVTGMPLSGVAVGLYDRTDDGYHINYYLIKDLGITDATGKLKIPFSELTDNHFIGGRTSDHFDSYVSAPDEAGATVNLSLAADAFWRIQLVNEQDHPLYFSAVYYQTFRGPAVEYLNISTNNSITLIKVPSNNFNQCIHWVLNPDLPELSGDTCAIFQPGEVVDLRVSY